LRYIATMGSTEPIDLLSDDAVDLGVRLTRGRRRLVRDLVRVREQHGYSRTQVADAIGIHKSGVTRFERQESDPRLSTVLRYAHAVGAEVRMDVEPVDGWACVDTAVVKHMKKWRTDVANGGDRDDIESSPESTWIAVLR